MRRVLGLFPRRGRAAAVVSATIALALVVEAGTVLAGAAPGPFRHGPVPRAPVSVGSRGVVVGHSIKNDVSLPVREIRPVARRTMLEHEANANPLLASRHRDAADPVVQRTLANPSMPSPIRSFDGIGFPGVSCNCAPPDTNGEAGATQYVQIVNQGFQVFDKATGTSVFGPVDIATLWSGFGGICEGSGEGDPVVVYDQLAGRWVISQFAGTSQPTDECVAVSGTSDATGAYHRYAFHLGSDFFDYPKLGVWPDAYYLSMNVFNAAGTAFLGPQAFAFDRAAMLAGNPAAVVIAPRGRSTDDAFMPADLDGVNPPPPGAPNPFVAVGTNPTWPLYRFHVNFANPAGSTWTLAGTLTPAPFSVVCGGLACVPQAGTADVLDTLGDRGMFRSAYRNFGDHEALVGNMTVGSSGVAGIRWFEIRNPTSGSPAFVQQSTYQPDNTWRWMGSAAMDGSGDLALGFSASSAVIHPQIRYAGRLAGDPPSQLSQGETALFAGAGSQRNTSNRWGDYSDLTIDPVDDCTFWYTNEYYATTDEFAWRTRIGSFKFPSCGVNTLTTAKAGSGSGAVTSSPAGISCGTACTFTFPHGRAITLHATAATGSVFAGWSGGGCSGAGACVVTLNANTTVTATFAVLRSLSVGKAGAGTGTVTSSPAGIDCGTTCSVQLADGESVTLTAAAAAGSRFTGWSGDCSGTGGCALTMSANHAATATFAKVPKCVVPKVVGRTLRKARGALVRAHCRLGKVTRKLSTRKKKGRVLSQRPKAGKTLAAGAKVQVVVGKGPRKR